MRNTNQLSWRSPSAILALLLAVAICALGINFMLHPHAGAAGYGVQVGSTDADTLLKAKGLRDLASGLVLCCLVTFASTRAVALFILTMTVIPFGDAILVAMTGDAPAYAVPMHAITGLLMLALSVLMLRRPSSVSASAVA